MAAAPAQDLPQYCLYDMDDEEIQQWVVANPGRINDRDLDYVTPLYEAAIHRNNVSLTVWLLDEIDAELDPLIIFDSPSSEILAVFLDRCTDSTLPTEDGDGWTLLMLQLAYGPYENVGYLLEDPRFRATINEDVRPGHGLTALCAACLNLTSDCPGMFRDLLEAGANPTVDNGDYSLRLWIFS